MVNVYKGCKPHSDTKMLNLIAASRILSAIFNDDSHLMDVLKSMFCYSLQYIKGWYKSATC